MFRFEDRLGPMPTTQFDAWSMNWLESRDLPFDFSGDSYFRAGHSRPNESELDKNRTSMFFRYRVAMPAGFDYVSRGLTQATGYPASDFYTNPRLLTNITVPEDRSHMAALLQAASPDRHPLTVRWLTSGGAALTVELSFRFIEDEDGNVVSVDVDAREIVPERRPVDALERNNACLRFALDLADNAIGVLHPLTRQNGEIVDFSWSYVNSATAKLLERDASDVMRSTVKQTFSPRSSKRLVGFLTELIGSRDAPGASHVFLTDERLSVRVTSYQGTIILTFTPDAKPRRDLMSEAIIASLEQATDPEADRHRRLDAMSDALLELGVDFAIVLLDAGETEEKIVIMRTSHECPAREQLDQAVTRWTSPQPEQLEDFAADVDTTVVRISTVESPRDVGPVIRDVLDMIEKAEPTSLDVVPLAGFDREIGTVIFGTARQATPLDDESRRLALLIVRRVAQQLEIENLRDEIHSMSDVREKFMSMVAHEIRTPLTGIRGYGQLLERFILRDQPNIERARRAVQGLRTQIERFQILASDLLDATRVHQGRLDLRLEHASLESIAFDAVERVKAHDEADGRVFTIDVQEPLVGLWDAGRIDQVLYILLTNAVTYSDEGEINLAARRVDNHAVVTISDQGVGIQEEEVETLFEPFTRGHRASRLSNGSGLGLYLAREIVRQHGGQIAIRSEPQVGTTVTIHLPLVANGSGPATRLPEA